MHENVPPVDDSVGQNSKLWFFKQAGTKCVHDWNCARVMHAIQ